MKFIQHLPGYFDESVDRFQIDFEDVQHLLEFEKIKQWAEMPEFYTFSKSLYWDANRYKQMSDFHKKMYEGFENGGWHLMAEFEKGKKWYVLGTANEDLALPVWEPRY